MKKFIVEMAVGYGVSLMVEAETKEEAIKTAKQKVLDDPMDYYDGNAEIEQITFVKDLTK